MDKSRLLIGGLRTLAAISGLTVSLGTGVAFASINADAGNELTGPNSLNVSEIEKDFDADIDIENNSDLNNQIDFWVNTGESEIEHNTTVEDVDGGDVQVDVELVNELNGNGMMSIGSGLDNEFDFSASNYLTGPSSENINRVEVDKDVDVRIRNNADIENELDIHANTGNNEIRNNTTVGDVSTGSIEVAADISNEVNAGGASFDICDNCLMNEDINADFSNDTTGPNSENTNILDIDSDVNIDIENNADIRNDFRINANTGENEVENNTSVGDVSTGDVVISISAMNVAN